MGSSSVTANWKRIFVVVAVVLGGLIIIYKKWSGSQSAFSVSSSVGSGPTIGTADSTLFDQKSIDVIKLPRALGTTEKELFAISVQNISISVDIKGKTLKIHSLQTEPKSPARLTVLLLHGLGDGAHNWKEVNTLQLLTLWGYKAIAVDLPGYGLSKEAELKDISRAEFMQGLVKTLGVKPVIVAPSMAGSFAIPYLFSDPNLSTERAVAFVPVSPVQSEKFRPSYHKSQLPTLLLYGAKDIGLGEFSKEVLKDLPKSHIAAIPGAGHACFKEKPDLFHRALYHYLNHLNR